MTNDGRHVDAWCEQLGQKRNNAASGAFFDQNEEFEMLVSLGKDAHCRRTYIGRQADENEMIRQKTAIITAPL